MALPPAVRTGLLAELAELGAAGLSVTELGRDPPPLEAGGGVVRIGVHRSGPRPAEALEVFDILLTHDPDAPRPWVCPPGSDIDEALAELEAEVTAQPAASAALVQVLRASLILSFDQALAQESLAYSMLLASAGFQDWRAANPARRRHADTGPRVQVETADRRIEIILTRPDSRNAVDAAMRDELAEALSFALAHPDAPAVSVRGAGPSFCAGGDLDEFGRAADPGDAHLIRVLRSPARLMQALGPRLTVNLHGACVGAGIEMPAAAGRVTARPGAVFRLPEVSMGLIPGAGGTATLPRRIGRRRTAFMALSGRDVDLATALAWGLVDEVAV